MDTSTRLFRILLFGDTHIGLDFPLNPRIERRRRGDDFLCNFRLALQPALEGQVDAVIHGGDLFDRSRIPDALVEIAFAPLVEAAQAGVPILLVPGNHERGKIPMQVWRSHANLHVFDQPGCITLQKNGLRVCIGGFPYTRKIQGEFSAQIQRTGLMETPADIRVLCMHQSVEGAQVGPVNFTFRYGPDIIRGADLPRGVAAFLSGHIHRCQVLKTDLCSRPLAAPVVYAGSVERTAFAEQHERKGYILLDFAPTENGGRLVKTRFIPLPARPMTALNVETDGVPPDVLRSRLQASLAALDPDSVVQIRLQDTVSEEAWQVFGAASLRALAPVSMNVEVAYRKSERNGEDQPEDLSG